MAASLPRRSARGKAKPIPSRPPLVVVVGAGVSGLVAAQALQLHGARAVVLEGRARIGGRVLTAHLGSGAQPFAAYAMHGSLPVPGQGRPAVDIGASVMHGVGDAVQYVWRRALRAGVRAPVVAGAGGYESTEWAAWFDERGARIAQRHVVEAHRFFDLAARYVFGAAYASNEPAASLRETFSAAFRHIAAVRGVGFTPLQKALLRKILARSYGYCAPTKDLALNQVDTLVDERTVYYQFGMPYPEDDPPGKDEMPVFKPRAITRDARYLDAILRDMKPTTPRAGKRGGNGDRLVIDGYTPFLVDQLKKGLDIRLKTIVKGIARAQPEVTEGQPEPQSDVSGSSNARDQEDQKRRMAVTTADGDVIECDYVVCTLPLGVLQREDASTSVTFSPPLSEEKRKAIAGFGMGVHNKVILRFHPDDVFWPQNVTQLNVLDQRFQFCNLHAYGKTGVILAHVFNETGFARGYSGLNDEEVVEEVVAVLHRAFCPDGKWTTRLPPSSPISSRPPARKGDAQVARTAQLPRSRPGFHTAQAGSKNAISPVSPPLERSASVSRSIPLPQPVVLGPASPMSAESELALRGVHGHSRGVSENALNTPECSKDAPCDEEILDGGNLSQSVAATPQASAAKRVSSEEKRTKPLPCFSVVTRWDSDPFSFGSYSYMPCGADFNFIHELRRPEDLGSDAPLLYFAGEHTSVLGWQCAHGAYESGLAAAHGVLLQSGLVASDTLPDDLDRKVSGIREARRTAGRKAARSSRKHRGKSHPLSQVRPEDPGRITALCADFARAPGHFFDVLEEMAFRLRNESSDDVSAVPAARAPGNADDDLDSYRTRHGLWLLICKAARRGDSAAVSFLQHRHLAAAREAGHSKIRYRFKKLKNRPRMLGLTVDMLEKHEDLLAHLLAKNNAQSLESVTRLFARKLYHQCGAILPPDQVRAWLSEHSSFRRAGLPDRIEEDVDLNEVLNMTAAEFDLTGLKFPTMRYFEAFQQVPCVNSVRKRKRPPDNARDEREDEEGTRAVQVFRHMHARKSGAPSIGPSRRSSAHHWRSAGNRAARYSARSPSDEMEESSDSEDEDERAPRGSASSDESGGSSEERRSLPCGRPDALSNPSSTSKATSSGKKLTSSSRNATSTGENDGLLSASSEESERPSSGEEYRLPAGLRLGPKRGKKRASAPVLPPVSRKRLSKGPRKSGSWSR